jgi:CRISPR-associated endonuclease/helicase Cas3
MAWVFWEACVPETLHQLFRQLISPLDPQGQWAPYSYQLAATEALLSGRRVVLRAPAGSGKTLAAWLAWLAGRGQSYDFPPALFHALPGGIFTGELHDRLERLAAGRGRIGIQTEGDAFDPFLLADGILTSADELLSVALHRPLGLHPGLANLNAGALLGAYLVFDEFPALAHRGALTAWLGLLRHYLPQAPALFATAVWPRALCARVAELLQAELIDAGDADCGGRRQWSAATTLSTDTILYRHLTRTIVVCNTVRGAQMLYRALRQAMSRGHQRTELLLLHQHQFHRHRRPVEARAAEVFQPGGAGNAILVTTPGIEVAADLSADLLITDPAPPDALLRRAGRCARYAGEEGQVLVGRISEFTPGEQYPSPQSEMLLARLVGAERHTFRDEMAALDALWEDAPDDMLPAALLAPPAAPEVDAAAAGLMSSTAPLPTDLFPRVGACLHRMPETIHDPFELERFSLATSSLERGWRQWRASGCPAVWFALIPQWPEGAERPPTWTVVEDPAQFHAEVRLVVLNAEAVSYDPILGLELAQGTPCDSERLPQQHTTWSPFDQFVQYYEDHAAGVLAAVEKLKPWYRYVLRHLGRRWRMPLVDLEQWLRLAVLWHDAGKLTAVWQRCAHRWQAEVMRRPIQHGVLARVDFRNDRDARFPCAEHAVNSGLVLYRALGAMLGARPYLQAGTLAALLYHHGYAATRGPDLTPHPQAWTTLLELAAQVVDDRLLRRLDRVGWTAAPRGLHELPPHPPTDPDAWMAYSLLVRAIRLADRNMAIDENL